MLPMLSVVAVLSLSARADAPEVQACVQAYGAEQVDEYNAEQLCDTPEERAARAPISRCVRELTRAGYEYGNKFEVCSEHRGFGDELPAYLRCYRAEAGSDTTEALNRCAVAEFRNNRAAVRECLRASRRHWEGAESLDHALFPLCIDPSLRPAIPEIATCSRALAAAPRPDWDDEPRSPLGSIEACSRPEVRSALSAISACRRSVVTEVNDALAASDALANLTAPEGQEDDSRPSVDRGAVGHSVRGLLDRCATEPTFRVDAVAALRCSNETVRAWGGIPFVTTREMNHSMLSYSSRALESSLALDRCLTPADRAFQARVLSCARISDRPEVAALGAILPERSDVRTLTYTWCTLETARAEQSAAGSPCP